MIETIVCDPKLTTVGGEQFADVRESLYFHGMFSHNCHKIMVMTFLLSFKLHTNSNRFRTERIIPLSFSAKNFWLWHSRSCSNSFPIFDFPRWIFFFHHESTVIFLYKDNNPVCSFHFFLELLVAN